MPDEIIPRAHPIASTGEPEWFPPPQDDAVVERRGPSRLQTPSTQRWVFFGADGLRAGWSLLLWVIFVAAIGAVVNKALHAVLQNRVPAHTTPEWLTMSSSALGFLAAGLAAFFVSKIEGRSWWKYGIGPLYGRIGQLVTGLFWGFAILSLLVFTLSKSGYLVFGEMNLHGAKVELRWGLLYALSFLFTGFFEEFTFRGFSQFTLTRGIAGALRSMGVQKHARRIGFWVTAILLAVGFGWVHKGNPGESRMGLYTAGLIGFVFAYSLWRSGSLWWAIGFHAAWDWGESFFYGTADSGGVAAHRLMTSLPQGDPYYSGGSVGPEGSVLALAAVVLTGIVVSQTLRPRPGYPRLVYEKGEYERERRVARVQPEVERRSQ